MGFLFRSAKDEGQVLKQSEASLRMFVDTLVETKDWTWCFQVGCLLGLNLKHVKGRVAKDLKETI